MVNFVFVEDNKKHRKRIKEIIMNYMMKNKIDFDILEFEKDTNLLRKVINYREHKHIYIFDFELPNTNAIDLARLVREKDWSSPIIVLTVNGGMAYETFKQRVQILDFVSKQYEAEKNMHELFDICFKQFKIKKSLKFKYKNQSYNLDYDKILYIYRDTTERKCVVVTDNDEYLVPISITDLNKKLDKDFHITHKACIVNLKRVESFDWKNNKIIFDNGTYTYLLSKTHKKELSRYVVS